MTFARTTRQRQSDRAGNDKMPKPREKSRQVGKAEGSFGGTPAAREDSGWGDSVGCFRTGTVYSCWYAVVMRSRFIFWLIFICEFTYCNVGGPLL